MGHSYPQMGGDGGWGGEVLGKGALNIEQAVTHIRYRRKNERLTQKSSIWE